MSHMKPIVKLYVVERDSIIKWKLFYINWTIGVLLSNYSELNWLHCITDSMNYHNLELDRDLFYIETDFTSDQYKFNIKNLSEKKVDVDNIWYFRDIFNLELIINIPNLKKLCAAFLAERRNQLKDISKHPEGEEQTEWDESTSEIYSGRTLRQSGISLTQLTDDSTPIPQPMYIQQMNDTSFDSNQQLWASTTRISQRDIARMIELSRLMNSSRLSVNSNQTPPRL